MYLKELSPVTTFLLLFVRSQLTSTITLGLIFFPKIWYQHKQVRYCLLDLDRIKNCFDQIVNYFIQIGKRFLL